MNISQEAKQAAEEWGKNFTQGSVLEQHKQYYADGYDTATAKAREELAETKAWATRFNNEVLAAHQQPSAITTNEQAYRDGTISQPSAPTAECLESKDGKHHFMGKPKRCACCEQVQPDAATSTADVEKLKEQVFQALGAASVCWVELPKGEFDATRCKEIGDELWQTINDAITNLKEGRAALERRLSKEIEYQQSVVAKLAQARAPLVEDKERLDWLIRNEARTVKLDYEQAAWEVYLPGQSLAMGKGRTARDAIDAALTGTGGKECPR